MDPTFIGSVPAWAAFFKVTPETEFYTDEAGVVYIQNDNGIDYDVMGTLQQLSMALGAAAKPSATAGATSVSPMIYIGGVLALLFAFEKGK